MGLTDEPPLYRDLMRLKPDDLTPNGWAVKAGVSRTVWSDVRRHGNPLPRTLEKLLEAAGSSLAEFEALRIGERPRPFLAGSAAGAEHARSAGWRLAPLPPIPLLAIRQGGEWQGDGRQFEWIELDLERLAGRVERPTSLTADSQAYAVTVIGESMWSRFRPGRKLLVSPAAHVANGDDVLLRLTSLSEQGKAMVMIKELVGRTPDLVQLRQFNPDTVLRSKRRRLRRFTRSSGKPSKQPSPATLASLVSPMLASPPDWLCVGLVGADGLEPPTLSV